MRITHNLLGFLASLCFFSMASAQSLLLAPESVSATGQFDNNISLLFDLDVPDRGTEFDMASNVFWQGNATQFTFDYGDQTTVSNLLIAADNNDSYLVEYSTDGVNYFDLFEFLVDDGPRPPVGIDGGGLDILTTDASFPEDPAASDPFTPAFVGRTFTEVNAQFLRVSATGGDGLNAIGEFQAFTSVPEPVVFPLAVALLGGSLLTRRRSTSCMSL